MDRATLGAEVDAVPIGPVLHREQPPCRAIHDVAIVVLRPVAVFRLEQDQLPAAAGMARTTIDADPVSFSPASSTSSASSGVRSSSPHSSHSMPQPGCDQPQDPQCHQVMMS